MRSEHNHLSNETAHEAFRSSAVLVRKFFKQPAAAKGSSTDSETKSRKRQSLNDLDQQHVDDAKDNEDEDEQCNVSNTSLLVEIKQEKKD